MTYATIIVRSMNDKPFIAQTLDMIMKQSFQDFDVINVDSGSTDGTYGIIQQYPRVTSYQINPQDYIPGKVLNDAVKKSNSDIIVFNNSDCIPQDTLWLENLLVPFATDDNTIATFGNQLPRPNARPLVRKDNQRAFGDGREAATWTHFFSLATSAIRRSTLETHPFNPTLQYSEDVDWSFRMKQQGLDICYAANACVEHSHNYSLKEVKKRFFNEGLAEGAIYNLPSSFLSGFILPYLAEIARDLLYLIKHCHFLHIPYGLIYRTVQRYAIYAGRKSYFRNLDKTES